VDHADHVRLLRDGVRDANERKAAGVTGVWADLGAGEGAFTLALAELLGADSTIHAIDQDAAALEVLATRYARLERRLGRAPGLETRVADFTKDLGLFELDGIVMANSLHFMKDKGPVLKRVRGMLKTGAPLLLVEYDADRGNPWVPYPISFETWRALAAANGFSEPRLLDSEPSRFMSRIYSTAANGI
jgi:ubiquinone/menaquinone biosynthesis C-methylase UbiE